MRFSVEAIGDIPFLWHGFTLSHGEYPRGWCKPRGFGETKPRLISAATLLAIVTFDVKVIAFLMDNGAKYFVAQNGCFVAQYYAIANSKFHSSRARVYWTLAPTREISD